MFGSKSDLPYYRHLSALLDHLLGPQESSPLDRSHNAEHPGVAPDQTLPAELFITGPKDAGKTAHVLRTASAYGLTVRPLEEHLVPGKETAAPATIEFDVHPVNPAEIEALLRKIHSEGGSK